MSCTDLAELRGRRAIFPISLASGKERNQKKWDHLTPEWTASYKHETTIAAHDTCNCYACNNRSHYGSVRSDMLINDMTSHESLESSESLVFEGVRSTGCLSRWQLLSDCAGFAPLSLATKTRGRVGATKNTTPREEDEDKVWTIGSRFSTPSHYW